MQNEKDKGTKSLGVYAEQKTLTGFFSTNMSVTQTSDFLCLDFVNGLTDNDRTLGARIYVTPAHAKQIAHILTKNIEAHEDAYGEIKTKFPEFNAPEFK